MVINFHHPSIGRTNANKYTQRFSLKSNQTSCMNYSNNWNITMHPKINKFQCECARRWRSTNKQIARRKFCWHKNCHPLAQSMGRFAFEDNARNKSSLNRIVLEWNTEWRMRMYRKRICTIRDRRHNSYHSVSQKQEKPNQNKSKRSEIARGANAKGACVIVTPTDHVLFTIWIGRCWLVGFCQHRRSPPLKRPSHLFWPNVKALSIRATMMLVPENRWWHCVYQRVDRSMGARSFGWRTACIIRPTAWKRFHWSLRHIWRCYYTIWLWLHSIDLANPLVNAFRWPPTVRPPSIALHSSVPPHGLQTPL